MRTTSQLPPSYATQPRNYLQVQNGLTPILDGRHRSEQHLLSPPIEIYHPAFASFIRNARDHSRSPPIGIIRETTKLIASASEICVEEQMYPKSKCDHLAKILDRPLVQTIHQNRTSVPDHISVVPVGYNSAALLIVVEKAELGTDNDTSVQASFSYLKHWTSQIVCLDTFCLLCVLTVVHSSFQTRVFSPHSL